MSLAADRARLIVSVATLALCGCRPMRVRLQLGRFEGTKPETVRVSCLAEGGRGALDYVWRLGPGVRALAGPPRGPVAMIALHDRAPSFIECTAVDRTGNRRAAVARFGAINIKAVLPAATKGGGALTLDGGGFGVRGPDDEVYLVPRSGPAVAADSTCPKAGWSETRIVACLPERAHGPVEIRVQSGGRLAVAPGAPLVLK
jgi:hypothetical protein